MKTFTPQYIGITGFMEPSEIQAIQDLIDPDGPKLMVGLMVSGKTLRGKKNKYPNKYPEVGRIAELLDSIDGSKAFGLIHFSSDRIALSKEIYWLLDIIRQYPREVPASLAGFQYNFVWPHVHEIELATQELRWVSENFINQSVLQIGPQALEYSTQGIVDKLAEYDRHSNPERQPILSHALIDMSGGFGASLNVRKAHDLVTTFLASENLQHLHWAVAGGLEADNLFRLRSLVEVYPGLSIDAEGRLRNPATDDLDLDKAKRYLETAQNILGGY